MSVCQFEAGRSATTGLPLQRLVGEGRFALVAALADHALVAVRPTLFGYQFVYELRAKAELSEAGTVNRGQTNGKVPSNRAFEYAR